MDDMLGWGAMMFRGRFAAVVSIIRMRFRLLHLDFGAIRIASAVAILISMGCGESCATKCETHHRCKDHFFDILVHFRPSLSYLVCFALDYLALTFS